jgi:hypothetical protein
MTPSTFMVRHVALLVRGVGMSGKLVVKGGPKAFTKRLDGVDSPEKALAFFRNEMRVKDDMLTMSSLIQPIPNSVTGSGLGLYSFYARVTCPHPETGEIVNGEIELTRGMEAAPVPIRSLLETGLKMAAAKSIKAGLFVQITQDNYLEYVRVGTEKFIEEHDRAERAEKALAEFRAEAQRQALEMIESHEAAMRQVQRQHQDELRSARQTMDACLRADAEKIEAADRRAHGWKRACRGIRQRYQHWKVAAITAYNILEGRAEAVKTLPVAEPVQLSRVEAEIIPESPPEPAPKARKTRALPAFTPLSEEEKKERQREMGRQRWASKTPEERKAHAAMMTAARLRH